MNKINKELLIGIVICLFLTITSVGVKVKLTIDRQEHYRELEAYNAIQDKRIEQLEKEVRLLKTDLFTAQNGFEGGTE
jgi:hypothetical protein